VTRASLSTLAVVHLGDGGTRHEKFVRDLVLLEADIRDNPDDPRTLFYLAQTRKDLGDHAGALAAYRRRIEVGGWAEEVFWSLYQCGAILAARGDWHYAQQALLAAWEYRPTRAEPLLVLAHGHRLRAQCHAALLMVERAAAIPLPTDLLFVETWVYEWGVDLELALNLVLAGQHERAVEVGGQLLAGERLPDQHRAPLEEHLRVAREALATVSPD
jgi:tetratricopeptide (TPR) repeat protein